MSRRILGNLTLALGVVLVLAQPIVGPLSVPRARPSSATAAASRSRRAASTSDYGDLPLAFELNTGQDADPAVRFVAHGGGYALALTPSAALLALTHPPAAPPPGRFARPSQPTSPAGLPQTRQPPALLGMTWFGANPHPRITGEQPLPGMVDYYLGNDPAQWHTNIPTYQQVRLHDVYPGVDLVYYGTSGQLEYDFVVAPGADPARIALGFIGADRLGVDLSGNLSLSLPGGTIAQNRPLIYQTVDGARQTIAGGYLLGSQGRIGFALGAYNSHLPLVIDPAYKFSTYLGGNSSDTGYAIAVGSTGNAYITGQTASANFPVTDLTNKLEGDSDAFVTEFNAAGTQLLYSAYLGGSGDENGSGIAVDASNRIYVTGATYSTDFPIISGAAQATFGGGLLDGFVVKINPGALRVKLVYSTYLGGSSDERGYGIAVDGGGAAYVTGFTVSTDFPVTSGVVQATFGGVGDAFVTAVNPTGTAWAYSTYLGGADSDDGNAIVVDGSGNAYVTGDTASTDFPVTTGAPQTSLDTSFDGFVTKLNASGTGLVYSTYLGGNSVDEGYGITVDSRGNAYVTGSTGSTNFPVTAGAWQTSYGQGNDAFVSKIDASGMALDYSTYLGGAASDAGGAIAVDSGGYAYVTGYTYSTDFPLVHALQTANVNTYTEGDAFVTRIAPDGAGSPFSTYLGGTDADRGYGIAVGAGALAYVAGYTASTDFPNANALYPTSRGSHDAFVTKLLTLPSVETTTGVFRPSNGALYLKNANTTGPADITLYYGKPGDLPVAGDWTGKGYRSIGIYRSGTFYLRNSNTTGYADLVVPFGTSGDVPLAGDWTGKGYDSIGVYRPSNDTFYLRNSNTTGAPDLTITFGASGDVPLVGDWTGKGWDSVGVFRPSNGMVYLRNSNTSGPGDLNFVYGTAGDKPVVGDWDANGTDTIGVDRGGRFLLRNSNTTGPANLSFYLGVSGDDPIAGPWVMPT